MGVVGWCLGAHSEVENTCVVPVPVPVPVLVLVLVLVVEEAQNFW